MVRVKPLEEIKRHYREAAGIAASRYRDAIPRIEWQGAALAGQALYEERMRDPNVLARRATKIREVSDSEFRAALETKGAPRIRAGIEAAVDKQAARYAPIRSALEALDLPPRTADFEENIRNRLVPVVRTMKEAAGKL